MKNMIISSLIIALLLAISLNISARGPLTFEERVKAQEAIEKVFYNHRIWPQENPQPKPSFEKMVPKESVEAKVTEYLTTCAALDKYWQRPIESGQLQAEMDRMAKGTKDPATLNELFTALNNDPYLIAECLARPMLADRLGRNWYANDERFHGETKARAEEVLKTLTADNFCNVEGAEYNKMKYKLGTKKIEADNNPDRIITVPEKEFARLAVEIPDEGRISKVIEKDNYFFIVHTILNSESEIEIESLAFPKASFERWINEQSDMSNMDIGVMLQRYLLPQINNSHGQEISSSVGLIDGCAPSEGYWSPTSTRADVTYARKDHQVIWTGAEMIIWGGVWLIYSIQTDTGGKYYPSTDSWIPTSTNNCPCPRNEHTAIWTGSEMIVWGGNRGYVSYYLNSGGRYNPISDTWVATSTATDCPLPRRGHTAIWTGTEMVIWGGYYFIIGDPNNCEYMTGGKYNPSTNSWTPTSTGTSCPQGRFGHTAVWTGTEMIVWGGGDGTSTMNTGGRYAPSTDSWIATSTGVNCPVSRMHHTAVWSGSEMIIWGGYCEYGTPNPQNTGGRYSPLTDSWVTTSTEANCPSLRESHTAVWTGKEMIVWGGWSGTAYLNSGGKYDPSVDSWVATSLGLDLPVGRAVHTAVWTGNTMIIWGGWLGGTNITDTGGVYSDDPFFPGLPNNTVTDISGCEKSGVIVAWTAPSGWGDGGYGTRTFDVFRDGTLIATGLSDTTESYIDTTGDTGIAYLYQIKANNGCGLSITTAGVSEADLSYAEPPEVFSINPCNWDPIPGADRYVVYRGSQWDLQYLMTPDPDGCIVYDGPSNSFDCSSDDPMMDGNLYWYIVIPYSGTCKGSAGAGTGFLRDLSDNGECWY